MQPYIFCKKEPENVCDFREKISLQRYKYRNYAGLAKISKQFQQ